MGYVGYQLLEKILGLGYSFNVVMGLMNAIVIIYGLVPYRSTQKVKLKDQGSNDPFDLLIQSRSVPIGA